MIPLHMAPPLGLRGFSPWLRGQHFQSERQLVRHPGPSRSVWYEPCVAMHGHPIRGPRPACLADLEKCFDAGRSTLGVVLAFRRASSMERITMPLLTKPVYHNNWQNGRDPGTSWAGAMPSLTRKQVDQPVDWGTRKGALPFEKIFDSIRHASCCGKENHHCEDRAIERLEKLRAKYADGGTLIPYYCVFCNGWHVGRKPKPSTVEHLSNLGALLTYPFSKPCPNCLREDLERERRRLK